MGRILAADASFSPPNPLDFSGSGAGSESGDGSGKKSQIQIVAFSLVGTFFLIFLVIICFKCNGCKTKNAVKNDRHGKNNQKNRETTVDHKKDKDKAKATPSDVKVDHKNKAKATPSDVKVDHKNKAKVGEKIDKHDENDKKKAEAFASNAKKLENERKLRRYTVEDLEAFTENYKERLGAGASGEVFKGKSPDGKDIAVKLLTSTYRERLAEKQFTAEVESIKNLHHRNVVKLLGFCYEKAKKDNSIPKTALVYEYMENGSLDKYLSRKKDEIEFEKFYGIAIGTAKGLAYLHEDCPKKIIHFDIKPANILLDSKFTPKVCDFGLAKLCDRDDTHISVDQIGGTFRYAAPEVRALKRRLTNKCDVYSFGMVLFKMVEVKSQNKNNNSESFSDWFPRCVRDAASTNKLEVLIGRNFDFSGEDKNKAIRACKVGLLCIQDLPSSRPLMSQVVRMLEGADPINLP